MKKKGLVIAASVMLVLCLAVGGTLAWLMDETETLTNTFTYGNIDITLDESEELDLKMIPGKTIIKDPVVTVVGESEACWLFVKIDKLNNFDDFMSYEMADGWIELETGVYYREVAADNADQEFPVIKDNKVFVGEDVTKDMMDGLTTENAPKLAFTAYAVQQEAANPAAAAWNIAKA